MLRSLFTILLCLMVTTVLVFQAGVSLLTPAGRLDDWVQVLVARLLVAAGLTSHRRRQVARLRLWGYGRAETAELLGLEPVKVDTEWRFAKQALRRALRAGRVDEMSAGEIAEATITDVDAREIARLEQRRCQRQVDSRWGI